jgi:hypothetical protein
MMDSPGGASAPEQRQEDVVCGLVRVRRRREKCTGLRRELLVVRVDDEGRCEQQQRQREQTEHRDA